MVIGPEGRCAFGTSGSGYLWEYESSINYRPDKYRKFLDESLARFQKAKAIAEDTALDAKARDAKLRELYLEILASLKEANAGVERSAGR